MPTTTPTAITPDILALCASIATGTPEFISVNPEAGCQPLECFQNVTLCAGSAVNGWIIWERAGAFIEAEHHCALKRPDGSLVDVTPHDGESRVLFLADPNATFNGKVARSNIRAATNTDPDIVDMIALANALDGPNRRINMYGPDSLTETQKRDGMKLAMDYVKALKKVDVNYPGGTVV